MTVRRMVDHTFKGWLNSEAQDGCLREGSESDSPWPLWLETRAAGDVIGAGHDGQSEHVVSLPCRAERWQLSKRDS